ncbi:MAG: bacterial Ig-like domain-containing protein [Acetatifactor sp.]|nr:bacterial Ig-like domain-containing protein [Acetatifactor sp.]
MFSAEALGAAKKYVQESLDGVGALKGAPCTIKSTTPISGGTRVTFGYTSNGGVESEASINVMNGADGADGQDGADATDAQVAQAVADYMDEHPVPGGGGSGEAVDLLDGKKILFIGDSICYGTGTNVLLGEHPYPYWIGQLHPTATIVNDGIAGATVAYQDPSVGASIAQRIMDGVYDAAAYDDVDVVVVEGGINDLMRNKPIGTIKTGNENIREKYYKTNINTFAGAMEYTMKYLTQRFYNKRIVFMTVHRLTSAIAQWKQWAYWECASEVCAKWSVEFLDLYHLIPTELTNSDLHPNGLTHKNWYTPIIDGLLNSNMRSKGSASHKFYGNPIIGISPLIYPPTYTTNTYTVGDTFSRSNWRVNSVGANMQNVAAVTSQITWDLSDVPVDGNNVLTTAGSYFVWGSCTIDGEMFDCCIPITVNASEGGGGDDSGGGDDTPAELTGIGATKTKTTYEVGETLNTNDITVTGTYTDNTTQDLTSQATIDTSNVDMTTAGTYTINVSVDGGYTATITITVSASVTPSEYAFNITKTATNDGVDVVEIKNIRSYLTPNTDNTVDVVYELSAEDSNGNALTGNAGAQYIKNRMKSPDKWAVPTTGPTTYSFTFNPSGVTGTDNDYTLKLADVGDGTTNGGNVYDFKCNITVNGVAVTP